MQKNILEQRTLCEKGVLDDGSVSRPSRPTRGPDLAVLPTQPQLGTNLNELFNQEANVNALVCYRPAIGPGALLSAWSQQFHLLSNGTFCCC